MQDGIVVLLCTNLLKSSYIFLIGCLTSFGRNVLPTELYYITGDRAPDEKV